MLIVPKKIDWRSDYFGMDNLELCNNRQHFLNYSKKITYEYNSRGFRDTEWPEDLSEVIWCVGDSFTVGIGQPHEETWPAMLQKKIGKRCINIGDDGCSNDTISLRVNKIYDLYKPKLIIVMWSYLHRRRTDDRNVHFDKNDFGNKADFNNFIKNYKTISKLKNLKILGLSYNIISNLPKEIGKLPNLKTLELKENNLYSIPKSIVELYNLEKLLLSNNKLTHLPKKIDKLCNLLKLDLDNNKITFLPKKLFNLPYLIGISINFNKLHNLPKTFRMSKIKYLSCIYNNLSDEYDDERLILNIKDLSKIDSILTIYKINQTVNKIFTI